MKVLKFGGKSLANGLGLTQVLSIIEDTLKEESDIAIVLSARGSTTNQLLELLELARSGSIFKDALQLFKEYQLEPIPTIDLQEEFQVIEDILTGVKLTRDYSPKTQDLIMAQGELLSIKLVSALLAAKGIKTQAVDSRNLLKTDSNFGNAAIDWEASEEKTLAYFKFISKDTLPIISGFIASNQQGLTTTLGRNGSNYSASLLANFLNAKSIISYTHVDGILTADPEFVKNVKVIRHINYNEASELAGFGATILHPKTIEPLVEKEIELQILNTFNRSEKGTIINNETNKSGIKSISVEKEVSLINIEGKGLLGKIGIDARIFSCLSRKDINIGIISQGSSERDVSFIIAKADTKLALSILHKEFKHELEYKYIHNIKAVDEVAVVTVVGQNIQDFASSLNYFKKNNIEILLVNNTISGNNIGLIIEKKDLKKAVNIIHSQIFGATKTLNIAIIGKGTVGGSLIDQILKAQSKILNKKNLHLKIFAIACSHKVLLDEQGISNDWKSQIELSPTNENITQSIIEFAKENQLENLIVIDNTSSEAFVENYKTFIENGFDLISSNKISNTQSYLKYKALRETLNVHNKEYLYETNVGAGLPIIDTIKILHDSGENITRIRGVFSGTLSFLFNSFSKSDKPFSYFLRQAIDKGYTEPDPREDLSGKDVARKLLILARELDLANELEEVQVENLIPGSLNNISVDSFLNNLESLDDYFDSQRKELKDDEVLRYVADLSGDLQQEKASLKVKLVKIKTDNAIGNLTGSDSIFEIYTESYGENPITILGAGAGAAVTARGVFGDVLRIAYKE